MIIWVGQYNNMKQHSIGTKISKSQLYETFNKKHIQQLSINRKLLNEELEIIQFIEERIHDNSPIFVNKIRIESSKNNDNVSIAANAITVLNSANVNMHYKDWNHVRFYQICLSKANITKASMNNIYFGEYAYLQDIQEFNFLQGTKILSYSDDNTNRMWDT
ncbi:hypothetical protein RFI_18076 [Reticulomyxa filosa]|uniref:Uncharacterized protein n=1 Tax=Reticulomyxa filosa TaxID=46433 RepID=X6N091_RETFI|nr:hypothetical protein RFI_18076 [Reticulomyxa filosa]|eukprot:ETO19159.1 hypothetical protein RFI_18076 [Reticulomyxa filosa]